MTNTKFGGGGEPCKGRECLFPDQALMQRFKEAKFKGAVEGATFSIESISPSCGDKICFSGKVSDGKIVELRFDGQGSMLSQVFADALCEYALGKEIALLVQLGDEDARQILSIEVGPTRFQTLLFVLGVLKEGLKKSC